jgi:hypothetical protein
MEERAIELPPMPELSDDEIDMILDAAKVPEPPEGWNDYDVQVVRAVLAHVNEQMQDYARAAVIQERERCARVCEEYAATKRRHSEEEKEDAEYAVAQMLEWRASGAAACAAAIRSGKPTP